jgi:hypothetical protein
MTKVITAFLRIVVKITVAAKSNIILTCSESGKFKIQPFTQLIDTLNNTIFGQADPFIRVLKTVSLTGRHFLQVGEAAVPRPHCTAVDIISCLKLKCKPL